MRHAPSIVPLIGSTGNIYQAPVLLFPTDVQQDQTPTLKEDGRVVTYDMMTSYFFSALASLAGGGFMPTVNWRIFKAPPSRMSMAPQKTVTLVASPLLGSLPKMSVSPLATTRSLLMTDMLPTLISI